MLQSYYLHADLFFLLMIRRPPRSTRTDTLFPYTTLFRSVEGALLHRHQGRNIAEFRVANHAIPKASPWRLPGHSHGTAFAVELPAGRTCRYANRAQLARPHTRREAA